MVSTSHGQRGGSFVLPYCTGLDRLIQICPTPLPVLLCYLSSLVLLRRQGTTEEFLDNDTTPIRVVVTTLQDEALRSPLIARTLRVRRHRTT